MNISKLLSLVLFGTAIVCTVFLYAIGSKSPNFFYFYIPQELWIVFSVCAIVFLFHAWSDILYGILEKWQAKSQVYTVLRYFFVLTFFAILFGAFSETLFLHFPDLNLLGRIMEIHSKLLFPFIVLTVVSGTLLWWLSSHEYSSSAANSKTNNTTSRMEWLTISILLLISLFVFSYNIDGRDFQSDEFQVIEAAKSFQETGSFYKWDWLQKKPGNLTECIEMDRHCHYTRAWPHTVLVSTSFVLFDVSEWSARIVSALLGVFFIAILYFFTRWATQSPHIALFVATLACIYPTYIALFRNTRMYALLLPLFLTLVYTLYRAITENAHPDLLRKLPSVVRLFLDFNWKWTLIGFVLLFFTTATHINSLVALPAIVVFLLILSLIHSPRQHQYALYASSALSILLILTFLVKSELIRLSFGHFLTFFGKNNTVYFAYLLNYPFSLSVGLALYLIALFSLPFEKEVVRTRLLFIHVIVVFSAIFFVYVGDRYAGFAYISHITPLVLLLTTFSLWRLLRAYPHAIRYTSVTLVLTLALLQFGDKAAGIYSSEDTGPQYSRAYHAIVENFDQTKDTLFGQYTRDYYLRELPAEIHRVPMLNRGNYEYRTFLEDVKSTERGWITWSTNKSYHIRSDIRLYIDTHFHKIHGHGIDDTNVEVYYFDSSMIK